LLSPGGVQELKSLLEKAVSKKYPSSLYQESDEMEVQRMAFFASLHLSGISSEARTCAFKTGFTRGADVVVLSEDEDDDSSGMSESRLKTEPGIDGYDSRRLEVARNLTAAIHNSLANLTPVPSSTSEVSHTQGLPITPPLHSDSNKLHSRANDLQTSIHDQQNFTVNSLVTATAQATHSGHNAHMDDKDTDSRDQSTPPSPLEPGSGNVGPLDLIQQQQTSPISYHRSSGALSSWQNNVGPLNGDTGSADLSPESSNYPQDAVSHYQHLHHQQQHLQHFDIPSESRNISPGIHQQMSPHSIANQQHTNQFR